MMVGTHRLVQRLPRSEQYWLGPQLNRSALSVASNIAEGYGRDHLGDYLHHLSIAKGSVTEHETQLLAVRALYPSRRTEAMILLALCDEIGRMLRSLSRRLRARMAPTRAREAARHPKT